MLQLAMNRLRRLTNGRAFPAPSNPRRGALPSGAKMGGASAHQLTRTGKAHGHYCHGIDLAKNIFAVHGVNVGVRCCCANPRWRAPNLGR